MGDWYELKWLAGVSYLEYQNEKSGWRTIAVELTEEQSKAVDKHNEALIEMQNRFYKKILEGDVIPEQYVTFSGLREAVERIYQIGISDGEAGIAFHTGNAELIKIALEICNEN